jgi:hypothetical protein
MVAWLLSMAALVVLVVLSALGAGTLIYVAASSKDAEPPAAPPERTSFPDTLDRQGPLAPRGDCLDAPRRWRGGGQ